MTGAVFQLKGGLGEGEVRFPPLGPPHPQSPLSSFSRLSHLQWSEVEGEGWEMTSTGGGCLDQRGLNAGAPGE